MISSKIHQDLTVLQVLPRLETGGVERGAVEIAQAIIGAGGRALVASQGGRMTAQLHEIGAETFEAPLASKNPFKIMANARFLTKLIEAENVNIVHARSRAPAWSAKWAAARAGRPFVTTYHGVYTENLPLKRRYNAVMASGDIVIAVSDFVADMIRKRHRAAADRIVTIPRGADLTAFSSAAVGPERVDALRSAWGVVGAERPLILLPGRLTRWKGQALFIEAIELLHRRGVSAFDALIVGAEDKGGRFADELRAMISDRGLAETVRLVGHCDDMPAAFKLADIAISASLEPEAFGRVAAEAQAMGALTVASAHGGAMETVLDGRTGWRFEPGSAEALATALGQALALDPETRARMTAAAADHIQRRYSVAAMQEATLQVYRRLAGGQGAR